MYLFTGDYRFELEIDNDTDFKEIIRIGNMTEKPRPRVEIHVEHDNTASIQSIEYDTVCPTNKVFERVELGTIQMVKAALRLCIDRNQNIKVIDLADETFYPLNRKERVLITPRRLLTGRHGWYQEYLGAEPTQKTLKMIKRIKPKQDVSNSSFWTFENIKKIAEPMLKERFGNLFGSTWTISKNTIMSYNVTYTLQEEQCGGRLLQKKSINTLNQLFIIEV